MTTSTTADAPVFVALEVLKRDVCLVFGRAPRADVDAWSRGDRSGMITLHDAHWLEATGRVEVLGKTPGILSAATGEMRVRADLVLSLVFMRDDDARALHSLQAVDDGTES